MSWTNTIRTQVADITGRTERDRLRRQVEEMQAELQTVKSSLTHALTILDSKEISNNTLKEQLASVTKELSEEKVWSGQQENLYREEIAQHKFENKQMNDRYKKLQDELEAAEKELKSMEDEYGEMVPLFEEVLEKFSAERQRNAELEEELKQKDLQLQSVREQLEEVKQASPSPGEDAEEQPPASDEADVDRSTEETAEEQSSASDETDVDRSTSVSPITEETAEEQSSASDDIEADVDRSTSASPITEETAEEQSSASDDIQTETDERRPPSIAPEPDLDQHLPVVSQGQSTEASTRAVRAAQTMRKFWKRVRDFFFRKRNKKKHESEPNTNRDNTTLTEQ
ncbi:uncharacterized protein LOC113744596 isoform X2 [Larimichthys crocea]|uniref:uncharacterized protein LOC113744596 isoform X2 n=1 Tax=Larimichthys crocea TaxID=215358 RepID=UPI000F5DE4BC|nr:uncharacterized protein LOC113744596 isoform X2 [Larimichthys crocea]